jgi:hypothetical protein
VSAYWDQIDKVTKTVETAKTPDEVVALLLTIAPPSSGDAFYGGDGDDLLAALYDAGWASHRYEAPYYWVVTAPNGEHLSYTEGDVSKGDNPACGR